MSITSNTRQPTWSRLAMAGLIATGLGRDAFAATADEAPPAPALNLLESSVYGPTTTIDNVRKALDFYARVLNATNIKAQPASGKPDKIMIATTIRGLQRALLGFRESELEPGRLPGLQENGVFDRDTAIMLMQVAVDIRMHSLFAVPSDEPHETPLAEDMGAVRAQLKSLALNEYAAHLEEIGVRLEAERTFNDRASQQSTSNAFLECSFSKQWSYGSRDFINMEITQVLEDNTYVSSLVPEACMHYLNPLTLAFRQKAQTEFLTFSPTIDDDTAKWCSHRESPAGTTRPRCLERHL